MGVEPRILRTMGVDNTTGHGVVVEVQQEGLQTGPVGVEPLSCG